MESVVVFHSHPALVPSKPLAMVQAHDDKKNPQDA